MMLMGAPSLCIGQAPTAVELTATQHAREHFERGLSLAQEERWGEARHAFERAGALVQRPSVSFNLALALYRLGELVAAARALDAFEVAGGGETSYAQGAQRLRQLIDKAVAVLLIEISPATAALKVDGEVSLQRGAARRVLLDPGVHTISIDAEAHVAQELTLPVSSGERLTRIVRLQMEPPEVVAVQAPVAKPKPPWVSPVASPPADADGSGLLSEPLLLGILGAVVIAGGVTALVLSAEDEVAEPSGGSLGKVIRLP